MTQLFDAYDKSYGDVVAVKDVSFATIFKGVLPFIATDMVRLVILIAFPSIALYLPSLM